MHQSLRRMLRLQDKDLNIDLLDIIISSIFKNFINISLIVSVTICIYLPEVIRGDCVRSPVIRGAVVCSS